MKFSHYLAQEIVDEMKNITNQDLNYFNQRGYVIASTDKERINSFHEGAKRAIDRKEEVIIEYDGQFKGAKRGINLPVYFEDRVVGVIGITGDKQEVEQYGKIIQRITSLLIKDGYTREQEMTEKESERQFIEELLFRYNANGKSLSMWAESLGFKEEVKRRVMVIKILNKEIKDEIVSPKITQAIYKSIRKKLSSNKQNLIIKSGRNIVVVYELRDMEELENKAINIIEKNEEKYEDINIYIGIGDNSNALLEIKKSYNQAKKALDIGYIMKRRKISIYENLDLGLLIDELPSEVIDEYISRVLKNLTLDELEDYGKILSVYVNHNGSINRAADELFIHKNTLQYRLNKLREITGYDPRNIRDMIVIYLAFILIRYRHRSEMVGMATKKRCEN